MSFILDALRKSDNERRQQATPGLAAAPRGVATKKRSIWLPILAVVLTINAMVFGTIFLTREEPAPVAVTSTLPPAEPEVRSLRKESFVEPASVAPTNVPVVKPPSATPDPAPVSAKPLAVNNPVADPVNSIQEGLPSLGQLRAAGLVSVADLRVDMHVYSGDTMKRFVFINMKKYREGERLTEGPTIEEITPDGVIMVQQGNRFRLDRD